MSKGLHLSLCRRNGLGVGLQHRQGSPEAIPSRGPEQRHQCIRGLGPKQRGPDSCSGRPQRRPRRPVAPAWSSQWRAPALVCLSQLKSLVSEVLDFGSNLENVEVPHTMLLVGGTAALTAVTQAPGWACLKGKLQAEEFVQLAAQGIHVRVPTSNTTGPSMHEMK